MTAADSEKAFAAVERSIVSKKKCMCNNKNERVSPVCR